MWKSEEEGITHINAYSKSKTQLGKLLSNFARSGIHTKHGSFESIEGLWYWLLTKDESLRTMYGWQAKNIGRKKLDEKSKEDFLEESFIQSIKEAIDYKISSNSTLRSLLKQNTLPIVHYYSYGDKVIEPQSNKWLWEYYEAKSKELKNENRSTKK